MIKQKTRLAMSQGLGGVMIWEIGQDSFDNPSQKMGTLSLLSGMLLLHVERVILVNSLFSHY